MTAEIRTVDPDRWRQAAQDARAEGWTFFDWLDGTDDLGRADTVTVVCQLRRHGPGTLETLRLRTSVARAAGVLPSLAEVFPGAGWAEREAGEGFAVVFEGGDPRRLLLNPEIPAGPLRKDRPLAARAVVDWPGAEPGQARTRRRQVPPAVPDPAVWGNRDPEAGPASAEDIAGSGPAGRSRHGRGGRR